MSDKKRYRVYEGVGLHVPKPGRKRRWDDLPLETIDVGDMIEIPLEEEETARLMRAVRSYAYRTGKEQEKKYSVGKSDYGIGIWRRE